MFDINGGELLVLLVVAAVVVGPQRLPAYAEQLGALVRRGRDWVSQTRTRLDEETAGVDWEALDPRRYDPRRIVRDALLEDPAAPARRGPSGVPGATSASRTLPLDGPPPFDDQAT